MSTNIFKYRWNYYITEYNFYCATFDTIVDDLLYKIGPEEFIIGCSKTYDTILV